MQCSFDFDLKQKTKKNKKKTQNLPARTYWKKKLWRTTKQLFFGALLQAYTVKLWATDVCLIHPKISTDLTEIWNSHFWSLQWNKD